MSEARAAGKNDVKRTAGAHRVWRIVAPALVVSGLWVGLFAGAQAPDLDVEIVTGAVSFADDVMPIFTGSCVECHGAVGSDGEVVTEEGLDLTSYRTLMAGSTWGTVVEAGDAEGSLLIELVVGGDMPSEGDPLTAEQIQVLTDWIAAGAENN